MLHLFQSKTVELSIVIVNWNGGELLKNCLRSILRSPASIPYDVIVVDNASTDEGVEWLLSHEIQAAFRESGGLHVLQNRENRGFSAANNQAFQFSKAPLLLMLNSDTEVRPGSIDQLVAAIHSDARIGACGPKLINPDGSLQVSVWRNPPTPWAILVEGLRLHCLLPKRIRGELLLGRHWGHNRKRRVRMLSGAAILVKRELILDVGGLNEEFHMYGEDCEWCLRMVRAGWQLIFHPGAVVMHHGGQSSMKRWGKADKQRVGFGALIQFQRCSLGHWHQIGNYSAQCLVLLLESVWRKVRGQPAEEIKLLFDLLSAELRGLLRVSPRCRAVTGESEKPVSAPPL